MSNSILARAAENRASGMDRIIAEARAAFAAPTHCAACGAPLTPQNRLRQHAGGITCSHGPHD